MQNEVDSLREKVATLKQLLARKGWRIERLEEQIHLQLLARFGRKGEVYENPLQPPLFGEVEQSTATGEDDPPAEVSVEHVIWNFEILNAPRSAATLTLVIFVPSMFGTFVQTVAP